ncbi:MAG: hypothetical protein K2N07_10190, partial [Desulfovibrio sp.]|nr:hypothetical protein [Desulfovibrio sp.]
FVFFCHPALVDLRPAFGEFSAYSLKNQQVILLAWLMLRGGAWAFSHKRPGCSYSEMILLRRKPL